MEVIKKNIPIKTLKIMSERMFGHLVKAVVDIEQEIMIVDADMHSDQEEFLLECGSKQDNLWGINLYPEQFLQENFIEFDSMINVRPLQNNRSRSVENKEIQKKIISIVKKMVTP